MPKTVPDLTLAGGRVRATLGEDLRLSVVAASDQRPLWQSSRQHPPHLLVAVDNRHVELPLAAAATRSVERCEDGSYCGYNLFLSDYGDGDFSVRLFFGIDAELDELLIEVEQVDGADTVSAVRDLYRFEKPTTAGGHMLLPHGSGYLIPADCRDALPGDSAAGGFIGARWSLPLFGLMAGDRTLCAISDTWWDCDVSVEHLPGAYSALSFHWEACLGQLAYPRRLLLRFGTNTDHVGMARWYRDHARRNGLARTLEEKAEETPVIRQYASNILYRWPAWNPDDGDAVLDDVQLLRDEGFGVNFFYPKWPPAGYSPEEGTPTTASAGWQAYLHASPVPGGWPTLVELERRLHELDCLVQGFVCPISQEPAGAAYDEDRGPRDASGRRRAHPLSSFDAVARMKQVLDAVESHGLALDVMYYDGFAAHTDLPEDFTPSHPRSRRDNVEAEVACFAETRRRGILPGAELARFWAIGECDYFFFTDWASDRLANTPSQGCAAPVGEPVPLFQLVFHDCFMAGFSGGGYRAYAEGYDWWKERTPRLYELMYAAAPSYNWLPYPVVPMRNRDSEQQRAKRSWLGRWSTFYSAVAFAEMVSHEILGDGERQRTEFANGICGEFDLAGNRFRIDGVDGFGDWEAPPVL